MKLAQSLLLGLLLPGCDTKDDTCTDDDGDGFYDALGCSDTAAGFRDEVDCDDEDANLNPVEPDYVDAHGTDQNCDGVDGIDQDGDGCASEGSGGSDCDDSDETTWSAAPETCGDCVVNDCEGSFADASAECRLAGTPTRPDGEMSVSGLTEGDAAGASIGSGDLNGDGFDDLLIGAHQREVATHFSDGAIYLVPGPLDRAELELDDPGVVELRGETAGSWLGTSITSADLDDDGYDDLMAGAPGWPDLTSLGYLGSVYVTLGPVDTAEAISASAELVIRGLGPYGDLGRDIAMAQAANEDGTGLLLSSGPDPSYRSNFRSVYGFSWPSASTTELDASEAGLIFIGAEFEEAGTDLGGAGDVNGDGLEDLIVGAPPFYGVEGEGVAYVVSGDARDVMYADDAYAMLRGASSFDAVGSSVRSAGDVNGDGTSDVLVGAPGFDGEGDDSGAAYLVTTLSPGESAIAETAIRLDGEAAGDQAGFTVSGAGDLDEDGLADVLVGAIGVDSTLADRGAAYLIYGDQVANMGLGSADLKVIGPDDAAVQQLGISLAQSANLDDDCYPDLLMGSGRSWDGGGYCAVNGAAHVVWGTGP